MFPFDGILIEKQQRRTLWLLTCDYRKRVSRGAVIISVEDFVVLVHDKLCASKATIVFVWHRHEPPYYLSLIHI